MYCFPAVKDIAFEAAPAKLEPSVIADEIVEPEVLRVSYAYVLPFTKPVTNSAPVTLVVSVSDKVASLAAPTIQPVL